MSKKATLSNSTAMGVSAIEADDTAKLNAQLDAEMLLAIGDNALSAQKLGSAEQRAAYCIMAYHQSLVDADNSPGALSTAIASMEMRKKLQDVMLERFAPPPAKLKDASDEKTQAKDDHNARSTLVKRALLYAAIFADANMLPSAFDHDTGMFSVPVRILLDTGEEPAFGLAKLTNVALDGRSYNVMHTDEAGKENGRRIQASCTRLRNIHIPTTSRAAGGQTSQDKAKDKAKTGTVKPTDFDVPALVKALTTTLCQPKGDADGPVHKDAYPDTVWHDLAALAHWYHDVTSKPDFVKPTTGPVKPTKAKASKAA